MIPKLKTRPALTLADFCKAAWPRVTTDPIHVGYLSSGQPHSTKLRGKVLAGLYVAVYCPTCGETTENLYSHPAGRGILCGDCLARCEPWGEDGSDE
jgi:hypothetical protein